MGYVIWIYKEYGDELAYILDLGNKLRSEVSLMPL
jgi:hypothetical protein